MIMTAVRRGLANLFWALSPWKLQREVATVTGPRILLGAPHTSNFDFVLMLAIAWDARMKIHWLGKKELFRGIAGPIMRGLGGIAVDRANAAGTVAAVTQRARKDDRFILVVTPEGTRSGNGWRNGFYRIAMAAGLTVTLGYPDKTTMTAGLGPTLQLTGDVVADMDIIREFYADKAGVNPRLRTEPRFRDEAGLTELLRHP
ncbi:1-acyl-sn-glycerol-3-phosphate acyltransferase [Leucobacter exalbidus]|uniref:1-acyl-sn-glycerol-3-phosphate acyltransferase n=1 Tax=Leucobacter exalbidus TaxID=662960 RepID=A0A940PSC3_9MICO|nr:1-acyl-sn-glycerol-3-phosphate acyltransferase [Leucobacter exalbidus]MBP1325888.1 1-acyl-sn-glycerol-3-phosphate acyltransferase [Leucobacter exalbidus]